MKEIILYQTKDNQTQVEVQIDGDTVWLSLNQIGELFDRDKSVVSRHLKNIFKSEELERNSVVAKNATTASDGKTYEVEYFNLDAILSVGYRVNSKRGTQFRQWATQRLKEHLVQGYSLNQKRLNELSQNMQQLEVAVNLIKNTAQNDELKLNEAKGLLNIITNYTQSFVLLNQYDSNSIKTRKLNTAITYEIQHPEANQAIVELKKQLMAKKEATELFGNEKDEGFKSSLRSIVQTFGGHYLYPSIEEQAAHLLYFVIKNHSFTDGNKRIGAFLFVWFLEKNKHRFKKNGEVKINDNGLTALALLVAQSHPSEKELMIKLIVNLIANA